MSVTDEGIMMLERIKTAIDSALPTTMADSLREQVAQTAEEKVYSYNPKFYSRRKESGGLIAKENLPAHLSAPQTLTMKNITGLQNLYGGGDSSPLTPIVEDGVEKYHMPYPREFMQPALDEYIDSGRAEADLAQALEAAGFTLM